MVRKRRRRRAKRSTRRRQRQQLGEGINTVIAGIPKVGWKITKELEKLAKKNAKKAHLKRMVEIQRGKRKRYTGESFTCNIM